MTNADGPELDAFLRGTVSFGDNKWFLEMVAREEARKLRGLHQAVCTWHDAAQAEFDRRVSKHGVPKPDMSEDEYEHFAGEAFSLLETQRIMLAGLAVAIASTVEAFLGAWCASIGIAIVDRKCKPIPKPGWGHKRQAVEEKLGASLDDIAGFDGCTKARVLGNCFKHSEGRTSAEYVEQYCGPKGAEIEYEKEDWCTLIGDTRTFLLELASRLETKE